MTSSDNWQSPGDSADLHEEQVSQVVAHYVDLLNTGADIDPDEVCQNHPDLAADVLEQLEAFVGGSSPAYDSELLGTLGDYTLRRQIGRGGMGVVYEAWQNSVERSVALKVLPAGVAADDKAFHRFMREAKTAAKLEHPHVVGVYGMGVEEHTPYFAMELVEGETLSRILAKIREADEDVETPFGKKGQLAFYSNLASAFADVSGGLQHAHSRGVVHRDIKPSNLILDGGSRLRILDFGIARIEGQESITISGDIVGTPLYMSPEQARRRKIPIDHRTDVYSLGATMYEALCGRPPFKGRDHQDTLSQIIHREPVSPRKLNSRVPRDLETVVRKCLRKDAGTRYGTAEALEQDLRRFVRGDCIEAKPPSTIERLIARTIRQRVKLAVLGAILLLAGGILWSLVQYRREVHLRHLADYDPTVTEAAVNILRARQAAPFSSVVPEEAELSTGGTRGLMIHGTLSPHELEVIHHLLEEAIAELREMVRLVPERPDAHYYLGRGLLLDGRTDEAIEQLERALSRSPGFAPALVILSAAYRRGGDVELASEVLARARSSARGTWGETWLEAHGAWRERQWAEALAAYDALIEADAREGPLYLGSSIELYLGRGQARLELDDFVGGSDGLRGGPSLGPAGDPTQPAARSAPLPQGRLRSRRRDLRETARGSDEHERGGARDRGYLSGAPNLRTGPRMDRGDRGRVSPGEGAGGVALGDRRVG